MEERDAKRVTRSQSRKKKEEEERPEWLPEGWTVEAGGVGEGGKRVQHYISPVAGCTFNSKKDALHYLEVTKLDGHDSNNTSFSEHNRQNVVQKVPSSPEWLPHGWILEIKTRLSGLKAGQKYKCYFDPFTGSRFYSKGDVFRFLKSGKLYTPTSTEKGCFKANATDNAIAQIEYSPDGLPQGWIKETMLRNSQGRVKKDPYYTDPVNGYVFRSLKEAIHYAETGELSKYALGHRKLSVSEMYSIEKESPPPIPLKELKSLEHSARRALFADEAPLLRGEMEMEIDKSPDKVPIPPPDNASRECLQKVELNSSPDIEHIDEKPNTKRRKVSDSANDNLVDTYEHGEQETKRGGATVEPSEHAAQSEDNVKKETKELLEQPKVAEKLLEPSKEITAVSQAKRKQRKSKGETISLPRRSSKRLAGLDPAPTGDLIIPRPLFQPASNGACNGNKEVLPLEKPEIVDNSEEASFRNQKVETGYKLKDPAPTIGLINRFVSHQPASNGSCNENKEPSQLLITRRTPHQPASIASCNEYKEPLPLEKPEVIDNLEEARIGNQKVETGNTSENKPSSSMLESPLGNFWTDPCIEFAVKMLTGEIPVLDEGMAVQEFVQKQLTSVETSNPNPDSVLPVGRPSIFPDPCIEFAVRTLMGEIPVLDPGIATQEYVQKPLTSVETLNPNLGSVVPMGRPSDPTPKDLPARENRLSLHEKAMTKASS